MVRKTACNIRVYPCTRQGKVLFALLLLRGADGVTFHAVCAAVDPWNFISFGRVRNEPDTVNSFLAALKHEVMIETNIIVSFIIRKSFMHHRFKLMLVSRHEASIIFSRRW